MGNLIFYECPLEYQLKDNNEKYGPKTKYEPNSDAANNYFKRRTKDPVGHIRFNDESKDHDIFLNTEGKPIITTYNTNIIQNIRKAENPEYDYGFVRGEETKFNGNTIKKTIIAIVIIIIVSVLLAILLDNSDWYLLLLLIFPAIAICLISIVNNSCYDCHVYIKPKKA